VLVLRERSKALKKLFVGPDARICDRCIDRVHTVLAAAGATASTPIATIRPVGDEADGRRCSFCGKGRYQVEAMTAASDVRICNECLDLCDEIISEEPPTPRR
jgi:ATP-dependent protease Clp ATPase subunit